MATPRARQGSSLRELRRLALACPDGVANEIIKQIRQEHRQATEPDRALVRDVRDRGGVCFPGGMSREEWRNRLPRALHGKKPRCVPADELAQELYDRGTTAEASTDAALDHLGMAYRRARSKPPIPEERELQRQARGLVRQRVDFLAKELIAEAERRGAASCRAPAARVAGRRGRPR